MVALANELGWKRGVEVGSGSGILARKFLTECALETLVGVDLGRNKLWRANLERLAKDFLSYRLVLLPSIKAASLVDDGWACFVFIDAGHSYDAVREDIKAWRSKVRPGGWFGGHDYHERYPGVIRAVDEAFPKRTLLSDWVWKA